MNSAYVNLVFSPLRWTLRSNTFIPWLLTGNVLGKVYLPTAFPIPLHHQSHPSHPPRHFLLCLLLWWDLEVVKEDLHLLFDRGANRLQKTVFFFTKRRQRAALFFFHRAVRRQSLVTNSILSCWLFTFKYQFKKVCFFNKFIIEVLTASCDLHA